MAQPIILIVEDEPLIRMCAVDFAEEAGYAALEAKDSGEALVFLEGRDDIAVLFTDITLPGDLDGIELAEQVAVRWPGIKVLLASGALTGLPADVAPGAYRLPKPYGLSQFLEALETVTAVSDGVR